MPSPNDFSVLADGTEQDIYNSTDNRMVQATIDVDVMQSGDTLVIKQYRKIVSGGSERQIRPTITISGADGSLPGAAKALETDPMSAPYGARITIQQTAGTNRTYVGSVDEL